MHKNSTNKTNSKSPLGDLGVCLGLIICMLLFPFGAFAQEGKWTNLFDGKTLNGWKQLGGNAKFEVIKGTIVGTTAPDTPNSFLCTEKEYGNFILELEFEVDPGLNSGIQFRSVFKDGLVRGYQYEIDPDMTTMYKGYPYNMDENGNIIPEGKEPRCWTGGIYDEKGRLWIGDLTHNPAARKAFMPGKWNKVRIEAKNDLLCTYINGVLAARIVDYVNPNGFIALQVHAVPQFKEMQVKYRNIRIQDLGLNQGPADMIDEYVSEWKDTKTGWLAQVYIDKTTKEHKVNLTDKPYANIAPLVTLNGKINGTILEFTNEEGWTGKIEKKRLTLEKDDIKFNGQKFYRVPPTLGATAPQNAIVLFDGSDLSQWGKLEPKAWTESSGEATETARLVPGRRLELYPEKGKNGSIITKQVFADCHLHLEFRLLGEVTNGGVYMMSRYEFNIKDSYGQGKGASTGAFGNIQTPAYPDPEMNYALPPMVWQTMDIDFTAPRFDVAGKKISNARATMYLNGELIYENAEIESLKGAAGRLGETTEGPIYLQEHGTAYQFRNIWIVQHP